MLQGLSDIAVTAWIAGIPPTTCTTWQELDGWYEELLWQWMWVELEDD